MDNGYRIIPGDRPILLTVPHAVPHLRPGYSWRWPKAAEDHTELVAQRLRGMTGAWLIIPVGIQERDPNWFSNSPYTAAATETIQRNDLQLVVDIHGAPSIRTSLVDYDFWDDPQGLNRRSEFALLKSFQDHGFSEKDIRRYDSHIRHPSTIAGLVTSHLNRPAVQVEIDYNLRRSTHPRHQNMLNALAAFINHRLA